jgi:hypothetical protein
MVTASFINRLSQAVDRIESQSQPRPWKVVTVPRGYHEDPDAARDRHYAAHPEDRGADVVIWHFSDDKETADENQDCGPPAGPVCEEP